MFKFYISVTFFALIGFQTQASQALTEYSALRTTTQRMQYMTRFHNTQCNGDRMSGVAKLAFVDMIVYEAGQARVIANFRNAVSAAVELEAQKSTMANVIMSGIPEGNTPKEQMILMVSSLACQELAAPYTEKGSFLLAIMKNLFFLR